MLKGVLKSLLPSGTRYRRLHFGPASGAVMPIDFAHQTRVYFGLYERELAEWYRRLLRPGMKAFDIGAADGYCSLLINRLTRGPVTAFECGDTERLRATFAANSPDLRAIQALVGSELPLDEASRRYFFPDFIKIDTEGAEADILESGPQTLERKPVLIIEVHGVDKERRCIDLLRSTYRIEIVDRTRFFPEYRPMEHNRWLVCHLGD